MNRTRRPAEKRSPWTREERIMLFRLEKIKDEERRIKRDLLERHSAGSIRTNLCMLRKEKIL